MAEKIPEEILQRILLVKNKRARLLLDTIISKGSITTAELKEIGYDHPPRAARDVRELGFKLKTTIVKNTITGKRMAAYTLVAKFEAGKLGRVQLPKKVRNEIIAAAGEKCQICGARHDLQVDHRVPYEVAGESLKDDVNAYMVLDGTCNRRKSWVCEHCPNFLKLKQISICQSCYWANPEEHSHIGMEPIRRVDLVFQGTEIKAFDAFRRANKQKGKDVDVALKELVAKSLK